MTFPNGAALLVELVLVSGVFCVFASSPGKRAIRKRTDEIQAYYVLSGLPLDEQLRQVRDGMVSPTKHERFWEWRRLRHERLELYAHYEAMTPLHDLCMADAKMRTEHWRVEEASLRNRMRLLMTPVPVPPHDTTRCPICREEQ